MQRRYRKFLLHAPLEVVKRHLRLEGEPLFTPEMADDLERSRFGPINEEIRADGPKPERLGRQVHAEMPGSRLIRKQPESIPDSHQNTPRGRIVGRDVASDFA